MDQPGHRSLQFLAGLYFINRRIEEAVLCIRHSVRNSISGSMVTYSHRYSRVFPVMAEAGKIAGDQRPVVRCQRRFCRTVKALKKWGFIRPVERYSVSNILLMFQRLLTQENAMAIAVNKPASASMADAFLLIQFPDRFFLF